MSRVSPCNCDPDEFGHLPACGVWYDDPPKRWWYDPPWKLTGPVFGVHLQRPPFHRGGDEHGRVTYCFMLPLLGRLVVASRTEKWIVP